MNEFAPYANEYEATEAYRDFLNEMHETVKIGDLSYDPARVLEEVDPVAFRCGFADWLDSEQENMEDEEEDESDATAWCLTCGQDNDEPHTDTAHEPNWIEYE